MATEIINKFVVNIDIFVFWKYLRVYNKGSFRMNHIRRYQENNVDRDLGSRERFG